MEGFTQEELEHFIVQAKRQTYVGGGKKLLPYRLGSKDRQNSEARQDYITQAGEMIMQSLSRMYLEERFLGRFEHREGHLSYVDQNEGDTHSFQGREQIFHGDDLVYELFLPRWQLARLARTSK